MLQKQVVVTRIQTLADGSLRLVVDLLNSSSEDAKAAYELMTKETSMILCETAALDNAVEQQEKEKPF